MRQRLFADLSGRRSELFPHQLGFMGPDPKPRPFQKHECLSDAKFLRYGCANMNFGGAQTWMT